VILSSLSPLPVTVLFSISSSQLLRRLEAEPDGGEITVTPFDASEKKKTKKGKTRERGKEEEGARLATWGQLKKDVRRALYAYDDANCLPLAVKEIQRLGVPPRFWEDLSY